MRIPFSKKKIKYGKKFFCKIKDEEKQKCSQRLKQTKQNKKSKKKSESVIIRQNPSSNAIYEKAAEEAFDAEQATMARQRQSNSGSNNRSSSASPMYSIFP